MPILELANSFKSAKSSFRFNSDLYFVRSSFAIIEIIHVIYNDFYGGRKICFALNPLINFIVQYKAIISSININQLSV